MRFHSPFEDVQWNAAVRTHAQMRRNLRDLRREFPPQTADEAQLLRQYRDAINAFGRLLLKSRGRIRPATLNELNDVAVEPFVAYLASRTVS